MFHTRLSRLFTLTALSAALIACGGGGDGSDDTLSSSGDDGTLSVGLTDAPVDNMNRVVITVTGLTVKSADSEAQTFSFDTPREFDLLTLQGGNAASLLEGETVEAGEYEWIRLELSDEAGTLFVETEDGAISDLFIPSGAQTGLKLVSGFTVPAGGSADFTIDFDVRKSLVNPPSPNAPADFFLKPALRLIDNTQAGTIAGTVDGSTVLAEQCADSQTFAGAVYVYEGSDITPDDLGATENAPLVTAPVSFDDESGSYTFTAAFIAAGDYTISYSCGMDDPEADDDLTFVQTQNVTVTASETTSVDLM